VLLAVAIGLYAMLETQKQTEARMAEQALLWKELAENTDIKVDWTYEAETDKGYEGLPYQSLEKYVKKAEKSILVLSISTYGGKKNQSLECGARDHYLEAIVEKVAEADKGFVYKRIQCLPQHINLEDKVSNDTLIRYMGQKNFNHLDDIIRVGNSSKGEGKTIHVSRRHDDTYPNSFLIIDDRYLAIAALGFLDKSKSPYTAGFIILDDKDKHIIPYFTAVFEQMAHDNKPFKEFPTMASEKSPGHSNKLR
jgi:hypothetical protein